MGGKLSCHIEIATQSRRTHRPLAGFRGLRRGALAARRRVFAALVCVKGSHA
jgi:hypothetical protein